MSDFNAIKATYPEDEIRAASPLDCAVGSLGDDIGAVAELVGLLSKRLRPVVLFEDVNKSAGEACDVRAPASPHVVSLHALGDRVQEIRATVAALLNRLEI